MPERELSPIFQGSATRKSKPSKSQNEGRVSINSGMFTFKGLSSHGKGFNDSTQCNTSSERVYELSNIGVQGRPRI